MTYRGDIRLGDTIDIKFTSRQTTGAPFTLAGSPVISAYVGNGTTEITAGITLTVDFDARTGLNNVRVVATSGNGFATATNVQLVITTGTVNSVSVVGEVIGSFSIENRSALMPTTAGRTAVVDAAGLIDANVVKVGPTGSGTAQTAGDLKTLIDAVDNFIDTEIAAIITTLGTPAGASISADILVIDNFVDGLESTLTLAAIADAVWDEAIAGHAGAGSTGEALSAAGGAGDPWITALPGAYGAGSAGKIVGDNINATISSRSSQTSVDDLPTNAELATALGTADDAVLAQIALVKTQTDLVTSARMGALTDLIDGGRLDLIFDQIAADLPSRITKNTAFTNFMFKMVDATDHVTAETGLTITATRSIDGAAFAANANTATEVSGGWYKIDLAAGDVNGNMIVLRFTGTGADTREVAIVTQP